VKTFEVNLTVGVSISKTPINVKGKEPGDCGSKTRIVVNAVEGSVRNRHLMIMKRFRG